MADEDPERDLEGDMFVIPVCHDRPGHNSKTPEDDECESCAWIQVSSRRFASPKVGFFIRVTQVPRRLYQFKP